MILWGKVNLSPVVGGKNPEQLAEELRQHKASLIRNIPVQGVHIDDIDMSQDVYSIYDEITGKQICFAQYLSPLRLVPWKMPSDLP